MISFEDLSKKTKNEIRSSKELSTAFSYYFSELVGRKPSFCCSFTDYSRLFKNQKTITMAKENSKYNVAYPKDFVLAYRHNKKTVRQRVKNASDEFLGNFLKYHAPAHYKDAKKRIVLKEVPKEQKSKPKQKAEKESVKTEPKNEK